MFTHQAENQRAPTPPPRHYYPGPAPESSYYAPTRPSYTTQAYQDKRLQAEYDSPQYLDNRLEYSSTNGDFEDVRVEEPRKVYRPPYQSTQPSVDQKRFWQSSVEVTPEEPQWPGYGNLMDSLLKGEATGQAYGVDSQPAASQYTPVTYATSRPTVGRRKGQDTNKYVGGPQQVSTKPIVVGPGLGSLPQIKGPGVYQHQPKSPKYQNQLKLQDKYPRWPHLQPPSDMLSSYSDRYCFIKLCSDVICISWTPSTMFCQVRVDPAVPAPAEPPEELDIPGPGEARVGGGEAAISSIYRFYRMTERMGWRY